MNKNNRSIYEGYEPLTLLDRSEYVVTLSIPDIANHNGRIYPIELWQRVLHADGEFQQRIRQGTVLGDLIHPDMLPIHRDYGERSSISPAILWTSVCIGCYRYEENTVFGRYKILNNLAGKLFKGLLERGAYPIYVPRGTGDIDHRDDGGIMINPDTYTLCTFDVTY